MGTHRFDTLIRHATVVDGSGRPARGADVAMTNGRIREVASGLAPADARHVVDADGLVAAPGFIDSHSHDDVYLLVEPGAGAKLDQGVTTVVTGNCGFSIAPLQAATRQEAMSTLALIGSQHLPGGGPQDFSFADYLDCLARARPALNVVPLVGHGTLRMAAMGITDRPAGKEDRQLMQRLLEEALEAGAFGFSSGLAYVPGTFAATDELIDLARALAVHGGIYATHMRSEADQVMAAIDEALTIGREAGIPVHISHHKVMGRNNWGRSRETLAHLTGATAAGMRVTCDVYPYTAGSTVLAAALPPELQAEGPAVFAERLKDPTVRRAVRRRIETETHGEWENLISVDTFDGMVLTQCPRHPEYTGRSIAAVAGAESRDPYDVFFDLVIEEKMDAMVVEFMMHEDDVVRILQHPFSMVGTDGLPGFGSGMFHPRFTGTFPRVLGRYVRQMEVLSLEAAVHKMTGLPAATFGLAGKGLLVPGCDADVVLFDPAAICDCGIYEAPGLKPVGIHGVWVNGHRVTEATTSRASERWGRVLRRNRAAA